MFGQSSFVHESLNLLPQGLAGEVSAFTFVALDKKFFLQVSEFVAMVVGIGLLLGKLELSCRVKACIKSTLDLEKFGFVMQLEFFHFCW